MNLGLDNRTALVVGGGSGLGAAVARALAAEGARVVVAGRNEEALAAMVESIMAVGGDAFAVRLDLADLTTLASALELARERYDEVEILFNNSGGPPPTPASGESVDLWRNHFESMVLGVIALTDRVLPAMQERNWGRVVTNVSSGVITPIPNLALSNALRLSLVGWSKTLAAEVAAQGVTVNLVVPGRIATDRVRALDEARAARDGTTKEAVAAASAATIPVGRYGNPEEYGAAVAFLASAQASFITGTMLRVDGGQIASI